jgi:hypothetical protein
VNNARLIATAPELFQALTDALELLENVYTVDTANGGEITHPAIPRIRAALAKAVAA